MKKLLTIPFCLLGLLVAAQQLPVEDTVKRNDLEGVTIIGNKGKSLPGAGLFIGIRQLEKLNQTNVNHVLRMIPGVNIRDEEGFGLRPNIGLRGTPVNRCTKITLMEDGILIAPAPYADPSAYYFPTFARMQGVEILKGSSQIKYGPYTIGGALNLISTAIPESFRANARLTYGSFNTNQQRIWVGNSGKDFDYVFEVNRLASQGFKQLDFGGNTGFDRRDVMGKLRWHSIKDSKVPQSVTLKFVNTTEEGNETYLGLTYEDYQENPLRRYAGTQKDILDLNHQHISVNYSVQPFKGLYVNASAYYSNTFRDWSRANKFGGESISTILSNPAGNDTAYKIMTGQSDGSIEYQSAARTYLSRGVQFNANYYFSTQQVRHKIQFGTRYHTDEADRFATLSTYSMLNGTMVLTGAGVKGNSENQIRGAESLATYLNYDIEFKGFKLSPGIRYEKIFFDFQNFGNADNARLGSALKTASNEISVWLPGIGINYTINKEMNVFAGIHKGFSPPGMPSVTSTTGQAKQESSTNYELGYRLENGNTHFQVSGFINEYKNILGSDNVSGGGAGTGDMFNAGNARIQGLEVSLGYDVLQKSTTSEWSLPLSLAYTYTSARFRETFVNAGGDWGTGTINQDDFIPFLTPHLISGNMGLGYKRFNTTLSVRYVGATRVMPGQDEIKLPSSEVSLADVNALAAFLIMDFSANFKLNNTFTAFTSINNLTNSKAIVANIPQGYRPNIPLSFNVGLKAEF